MEFEIQTREFDGISCPIIVCDGKTDGWTCLKLAKVIDGLGGTDKQNRRLILDVTEVPDLGPSEVAVILGHQIIKPSERRFRVTTLLNPSEKIINCLTVGGVLDYFNPMTS